MLRAPTVAPRRALSSPWRLALLLALGGLPAVHAEEYLPADQGQRPQGSGAQVLPEKFLRGFDPITVYFPDNVAPGRAPADDGAKQLRLRPAWPGAYFWADRKTLQFRPAEPWPPLASFSVEAGGVKRELKTMMSAPSAMSPTPETDNLKPFRTLTLTFPQALQVAALQRMIRLEVRDLPGLGDSPRQVVNDFSITQLPRARDRDPAVYAITMDQDVPEGKRLVVRVALADDEEDKTLWTGGLSTRVPFHLQGVECGNARFSLEGGASVPRDLALACGNSGATPQLTFSAPVRDLTLTALKKLVRLDPAVPDLHFDTYGTRVNLRGRFVPDVLYRMQVGAAPIADDTGRALKDPGELSVFFYVGWRSPFLRWSQSTAMLESAGPRMLPLTGYGDPRADVRVYRVDPLATSLWPFPDGVLTVPEQEDPPFPGEEPETPSEPTGVSRSSLVQHIRLLGSPLVSRVVDLPLAEKGGPTRFGLDVGGLLDPVVGKNRPGTYLVGLRRLTGRPERTYMRVQVTNLSLTAAEERTQAVLFVRTLDRVDPVKGARVVLEGRRRERDGDVPAQLTLTTDDNGRALLGRLKDWTRLYRVSVQSGDDVLVINPREAPPRFANNHWASDTEWLSWLSQAPPPPVNDKPLGFLFTERPIYRPGEKVFIKGYVRRKLTGELQAPLEARQYTLTVNGPGEQSWTLPVAFTALGGFSAEWMEADVATGSYSVVLAQKNPSLTLYERSFQVEAYRIPTFEVQINTPTRTRLDGPFKARAVARYYAGGNVAGQPITWTVTRRPYFHVPAGQPGFLFASSTQFARPEASRAPETITRTGTLDDNGSDQLTINPALDVDGSPRVYRFEATVTGADDQQVTTVQETKALPPFVLGVKLPRYLEKATELTPEVVAVGFDDKLLKGQDVTVRLYRRVWHSHLRETNFATGQAKYVTEQEDQKLQEKTVSTDVNAVKLSFPVPESGVYVVELFARDKLGRVQTLSADLFVGGAQPVAWQKSREGVFELSTDKKTYRPGDVAKLVIQSPVQSGRALVIVEEPAGNTYAWKDVSGGKAVVDVKIGTQHVPNLPVHVVLMRGRLGEGKTEDGRFRPETLASTLDLEVEPVRNSVDVSVEHPDTARPGSKIDLTVTLADDQKKPLGGEVTLWLVDEAVLSLAREGTLDPLSRFIERNARTSSVRDTRNTVVGKLFEQEEEPGGDGEDEDGNAKSRVVRKNFQTVPYYQATLVVPASGKLVVPITLSDDLTNFRVRAVAASGLSRFGWASSTLHVRLPLLVQPQLPRAIRQGDKFWGGGVARLLEGAEGAGVVDMEVLGPVDGKGSKQPVDLKRNAALSTLFPFTARSTAVTTLQELTVRVGVTRKSDGVGDAFEVKIPVLPDRMLERVTGFEQLKEGPWALKALPEAPRPGTAVQSVVFTTEAGVLELAASLDYLAQYPHGCLEQRMSRLTPQVAQGALLQKLGLDSGLSNAIKGHLRRLLDEMGPHVDQQGLLAYWPGGTGDVALTAQAVEFMDGARKAGVSVDDKLYNRTVDALRRVLRSDFPGLIVSYRYNQQTAAIRALSRIGQLDEHYAVDLFHNRADMDVTSLADLTVAMSAQPTLFKTNLEALKQDLWDSVVVKLSRGKPVFEGLKWRRTDWSLGYLGSNTSTVAAVFEALLTVDPANARHEQLRDALVSYATAAAGFGNTHDNRRAIAALGRYLEVGRSPGPDRTVEIATVGELKLDAAHKVAQRTVVADAPLSGTVKGGGVGMRASTVYLPGATGDQVSALKQGFIVSRSSTLIHADGTSEAETDDKPGDVRTLAVGDILELHARITSDQERYHVALVVPFAAGMEPLNAALENASAEARPSQADSLAASYVQKLDTENRYYFTRLPRGTHTFHLRVRATTQGSFVHPAPFAEQMYHQDVRGRGEGLRIRVTGANEK